MNFDGVAYPAKGGILVPMGFFWDKNLPIETRIGNLIGDVIVLILVLVFAWAFITPYL